MPNYPPDGYRWPRNSQRYRKFEFCYSAAQISEEEDSGNFDCWIERRIAYLRREHQLLRAGEIGRHYLHCACGAYAEFIASGSLKSRYQSWLAIRTCCQWLSQLGRPQ